MGSTDEINPSIWLAGADSDADYPPLQRGFHYDVLVVGAGITGLTTARLLVDAGAKVAVVDAGKIASGATGYSTAKVTALQQTRLSEIRSGLGDDYMRVYAEANAAAVERVAQFVTEDQIACDFERAPACTYAIDDEGATSIAAEHDAAKASGFDARFDADTELPFAVSAAVWLDNQAQFDPRAYCSGLAQAIVAKGGAVCERTRVCDAEETGNVVELQTEIGVVRADNVVLASHMPIGLDGLFFARVAPYRSYALAARLAGARIRGMYIGTGSPTGSVRSTRDGWTLIGGENHKVGQELDTTARYAALEVWARKTFDVREIGYRWSAQDPSTLDRMPYIGQLTSKRTHTWVATGYGKWGMTNGTVAGMILSERILGRDHPWQAAFDSTRAKPMVSLNRIVKENLNVAKHFVADRLTKDGPTCTHLGCRTTFNNAEGTWDCPCHGSRFDTDGRVIEGPAVRDLSAAQTRPRAAG
ncbi:MAG: hypothetical protein QOF21_1350 [Actinomycetota bacterium]|jgi:glycine/D-amino acid oxidase-like deaminating enzyme